MSDDLPTTATTEESQNTGNTLADLQVRQPTEYDKMITDMLKHITTLNTGLLAIIAAFNQQIVPIFRLNPDFTTYFLLTFFLSLALCMAGFVTTIFVLHKKDTENWVRTREIITFIAATGYIFSLMFLLAMFALAYEAS
jgi:hypothetical protein